MSALQIKLAEGAKPANATEHRDPVQGNITALHAKRSEIAARPVVVQPSERPGATGETTRGRVLLAADAGQWPLRSKAVFGAWQLEKHPYSF